MFSPPFFISREEMSLTHPSPLFFVSADSKRDMGALSCL